MNFKKYIPEYKKTLALALPVILAQAGQVFVQIADNVMVGRLGATQLAAAAFGGAIFWNGMVLGIGVSFGLTPIIGQLFVKRGTRRDSAHFFQNSLLLNLLVGVALALVLWGISRAFPYMGQEEGVIELATPYYSYLLLSIVPFMLFNAFRQFFEGLGNTRMAMWITLSANVLNIILNYAFIYGHFGAPAMGVAGAGLATFVSRALMPVAFWIYMLYKNSYRRYFAFFRRDHFSLARVMALGKMGFPIAMQMLMEVTAFSLTAIMMGWFGAVPLAASQITLQMVTMSFLTVGGIASAVTIRISHEAGRGDLRAVRRVSTSAYHLTIAYMALMGGIFVIFRHWIAAAFTPDPAVIALAAQLLIVGAIFEISDGLQAVTLGMLRGIKDVRGPMVVAFFAYIAINLPVAYLLAFPLGLGPVGLWAGFVFGLTTAAVLFIRRYRRDLRKMTLARR